MPAIIFDCDGVLAETEREVHLPAFNRAFLDFGLPVAWGALEYGELLRVAGGKERIASVLGPEAAAARGLSRAELVRRVHERKQVVVGELLESGSLEARPGVLRLVRSAADDGWRLAVASTSAAGSVRSVLRTALGQALADEFAVFAGDDVPVKKPDPAIYQLALERLRVEREETIVIEDSTNGLRAARAAELTCLVTVSDYTTDEDFTGAAAVLSDLGDPGRPMSVIANRDAVPLGDYVTLDDLERILAKRRGHPASRGS